VESYTKYFWKTRWQNSNFLKSQWLFLLRTKFLRRWKKIVQWTFWFGLLLHSSHLTNLMSKKGRFSSRNTCNRKPSDGCEWNEKIHEYLKKNYLYLYFNSGTVFFRFPEYIKIFFLYDFLMCASDVVFFPLNFILINFVKLYCTYWNRAFC
jgi:hypothetical protein